MPQPDWADTDYDPWETPDTGSEILGRGLRQRKSKTFLQSPEHSTLLGFVGGHIRMLMETFRHLHARHYTVKAVVEEEDGSERVEHIPEVLSDDEIQQRYPVLYEWEKMHQEHVDHAASIGGFSVRAVSHFDQYEGKKAKDRGESSAGTDKGGARDQVRWK